MAKNSNVVYLHKHRENASIRLFLFPYAGAGISAYRSWASLFDDSVEVYTVQYPGRENRTQIPLCQNFGQLVSDICEALLPYCDKPFAFFAHSLGGLIAYEVSRQLYKKYCRLPAFFFVSGLSPPHIVAAEDKPTLIRDMSDNELLELIGKLEETPIPVLQTPKILSRYLAILRNDFILYQEYMHTEPLRLDCPIYGMAGDSDTYVNRQQLKKWQQYTTKNIKVKLFSGGHFYIKEHKHEIIQIINQHLKLLVNP